MAPPMNAEFSEKVLLFTASVIGAAEEDVELGIARLRRVETWGLLTPAGLDRKLARLHLLSATPREAEPYLRRIVARNPNDLESRLRLARMLLDPMM